MKKFSPYLPFQTLPFLKTGTMQTIAAYYFPYNPLLSPEAQHTIDLKKHEQIILIENRPKKLIASKRIILMLHGLNGSHRSKYLIRLTKQFIRDGYHVFRLETKHFFHGGRSEDPRAALHWLKKHFPDQPVTQIGFSLGGNITLKMAGEDADTPSGNLDSVIAVSPPLDLFQTVKLIIHPQNKLFNQYFTQGLFQTAKKTLKTLDHPSPITNVYEFDDAYTAPRSGFKNALDYYTQCSSKSFIEHIRIPTFLLYAKDDPLVPRRPYFSLPEKENIEVLLTTKGGHMGWIGPTEPRFHFRWMDQTIVNWVNRFDKKYRLLKEGNSA